MNRLKTLRVRFALWTAGLLGATLVLFGIFVYTNMSRSLVAAVDETLRLIEIQLMNELDIKDAEIIPPENPGEETLFTQLREQGFSIRVLNRSGRSVQQYGPYQDLPQPQGNLILANPPDEFITIFDRASRDPLRVYSAPIIDNDRFVGTLQVVQNLNHLKRTLDLLLITLVIAGPAVVMVAGGGGYFLVARALDPIDKITRTAGHISGSDLSSRLNLPSTDDEVGRLAATFDSMLARLEDAFRRERQFTADASHELRTPLATIQTIIGSTLTRQRAAADYEKAMADMSREAERMRTLTEGLLHLARNDGAGQTAKFECVDLSILLRDVVDSLEPVAEDKGLTLTANMSNTDLTLMGDSDSLIRLFVNLLENAIKYTEHGSITLAAKPQDDKFLVVTVSDTGAGIAPDHLLHIFDRFYRVDAARSKEGIGLGLAIAQNVARAHGGEVSVESKVGKGTTFSVKLSRGAVGL
jgi:heavy metal sensor kinase